MGTYEVREAVVSALRAAAAIECRCAAGRQAAAAAAKVLADVAAMGLRVARWRNPAVQEVNVGTVHVAGPVISSREYRRSCPGFIVDQRQACLRCARQLVRGKFTPAFFRPGEAVVTDQFHQVHPMPADAWRRLGGRVWHDCGSTPPRPEQGPATRGSG